MHVRKHKHTDDRWPRNERAGRHWLGWAGWTAARGVSRRRHLGNYGEDEGWETKQAARRNMHRRSPAPGVPKNKKKITGCPTRRKEIPSADTRDRFFRPDENVGTLVTFEWSKNTGVGLRKIISLSLSLSLFLLLSNIFDIVLLFN